MNNERRKEIVDILDGLLKRKYNGQTWGCEKFICEIRNERNLFHPNRVIWWWIYSDKKYGHRITNFENVLDNVSDETKEKLLFHLDIFLERPSLE